MYSQWKLRRNGEVGKVMGISFGENDDDMWLFVKGSRILRVRKIKGNLKGKVNISCIISIALVIMIDVERLKKEKGNFGSCLM